MTRRDKTSGDALEEYINAILSTSAVGSCVEIIRSGEKVDKVNVFLEEYVMRLQVASASVAYDPEIFCGMINDQVTTSKFSAAVGITMANPQYPDWETFYANEQKMRGFASATHAEKRKGVSPELLEKIWRIDNSTVKRTIRTTTQLNKQEANSKLSRNFGTNDRMLRYIRIKSYFFANTLFVTKKEGISRGYTCMQIFVSYKGYVFIAAMKSISEFPKSLKMFAKEVGVPEAIIADSYKYHKS